MPWSDMMINVKDAGPVLSDDGRILKTLVLGDAKRWIQTGREIPRIKGFVFSDVADLSAAVLMIIRPDMILSPLKIRDHDVISIARKLDQLRFNGLYRVAVQGLPDKSVVTRDIANVAPNLDVALLDIQELKSMS